MAVRLVVKSATDLPKLDRFSKIDPYCELTFHDEKQSTTMIANNQSPEWNESFKWTLEVVPEATEVINVLLLDHETLGKNRAVCKGSIPLSTALEQGSASLDVAVTDPEGEPLESKLHVDLSYRAPISESLKGEVGTLESKVKELEEQLNNLKITMAEKDTQISDLTEQVDPLKATVAQKDSELTGANSEIEQLKAAATAKETELSDAKQTIEQLTAENEQLKATSTAQATELARLKEENDRLKESTGSAKSPQEEQPQQPKEPQEVTQPAATNTPDEDLRSQNESLTREVATLRQRIQELEQQQSTRPEGRQAQTRCCGVL